MSQAVKEGVAKAASSYWLRRLATKFSSGEYKTEAASCFCGSSDAVPIVETDRYGQDYRMVLCKRCGLIYANPRMTAETYASFYDEEYRKIYDEDEADDSEQFKNGLKIGTDLKGFLEHFDIKPASVIDIGCNMGGMLAAFQADGAEVVGCDLSSRQVAYGQRQGIPIVRGGIETLISDGRKADLVILHHVFEHFLHLESELSKIKELLNPGGHLYIGLPGLYTWNKDLLWQNAHTYQFTAGTLNYVMECCGFEELYCDEWICSLWVYSGVIRSKDQVLGESRDILDYLAGRKRRMPMIRTTNKFSMKERKENIKTALSYGIPDMHQICGSETRLDAVIVGGGPSINDQIDKIRTLRDSGAAIVSIERMYPWCQENGLGPDYVVVLDASQDVHLGIDKIRPETTHLISTQCGKDVLEKLMAHKSYIFNTSQRGINMADYWHEHDYQHVTVVNAGGSVTLGAMSIALALGCRNLHIFGFDCHVTGGEYAKGIVGVGDIKHAYQVEVDGRVFMTTTPFVSFAQQFFLLMDMAKNNNRLDSVKVYGDSLVCAMSRENIGG